MTEAPAHTDDPTASFIATARAVADAAGPEGLSVIQITDRLDERAFGLLILIFAIPCLVPGLPGAQIIAIPIFLLGLQMALGRQEPWLPAWFLRAQVKKNWLEGIAGFCDKRLRWTERVARPRLTFLASGFAERLVGLIIALAAMTIMIPITNTIPSLAITLMAVGLLQRDGVFTLAGALTALAWVGLLIGLVVGLAYGAGFAVAFVQKHLPWLAGVVPAL